MLRIQIIGLALVSALVMSAVVVGSASAETALHQWLLVHDESGVHLLLKEPIKIHSLGLLLLTDHTAPGGEVVVHCHGLDDGTVGPHGLDLILAITTELLKGSDKIPCIFDKAGLCKSNVAPLALALNLPWLTHLFLEGNEVRDAILGDGNGVPGWLVSCTNILGGASHDICLAEGSGGSVGIHNVHGVGVEGLFDGKGPTPNAECSLNGGASRKGEVGLVRGTTTFFNPSATLLLEVSFN